MLSQLKIAFSYQSNLLVKYFHFSLNPTTAPLFVDFANVNKCSAKKKAKVKKTFIKSCLSILGVQMWLIYTPSISLFLLICRTSHYFLRRKGWHLLEDYFSLSNLHFPHTPSIAVEDVMVGVCDILLMSRLFRETSLLT